MTASGCYVSRLPLVFLLQRLAGAACLPASLFLGLGLKHKERLLARAMAKPAAAGHSKPPTAPMVRLLWSNTLSLLLRFGTERVRVPRVRLK